MKGFTLIEMVRTIVTLGILAALAVPAFQAAMERERDRAAARGYEECVMRILLEADTDLQGAQYVCRREVSP